MELSGHRPGQSVVEIAYRVLKERGEPIKYRDLVQRVVDEKGVGPGVNVPRLMAKAHTEISMDNRFQNRGGGLCGLREWTAKPPAIKVVELPSAERPKPGERLRRELETIDEDYQEESTEEEPAGEPEEPEEG